MKNPFKKLSPSEYFMNLIDEGLRDVDDIDDIIDRMQERRGPLLSRETVSLIDLEKEKDND